MLKLNNLAAETDIRQTAGFSSWEAPAPSRSSFPEAMMTEATLRGMEQSLTGKRLVHSTAVRIADLLYGYLDYHDTDVFSQGTGISAEALTDELAERATRRMIQSQRYGHVNVVRGTHQFSIGDVQFDVCGHNVILQQGRRSSEVDGCVMIGEDPDRIALYDVTTSAQYLHDKLQSGERFFQNVRTSVRDAMGIEIEKHHILLRGQDVGLLDPYSAPISVHALPASATPENGVHVWALPIRDQVRITRNRAINHLLDAGFIERHGARLHFV